ncbi:helix-turn-helix domain-containing protein [Spirochaetia bacterium 38H-sp]|uniref:Helix-turn-helix domain-containing protein n=1 Tax=Rarispira pelagica TaxID=3141764 RepID=A0ABU9UA09_9SPIR
MESLGRILKETRESRGLSLVQAEKETFILKSYLEALEQENFSVFPGETYLLGFLRSYSEYLGLDAARMVSLYKNIVKQEQEPPIEELVGQKTSFSLVHILGIFAAAGAVAFIVWFFAFREPVVGQTAVSESQELSLLDFTGGVMEKTFSEGSGVNVLINDSSYPVVFKEFADSHVVAEYSDGKFVNIPLRGELKLDITGDGAPDIKIIARDYMEKASGKELVIRIDRAVNMPSPQGPSDMLSVEENEIIANSGDSLLSPIGSTLESSRKLVSYSVLTSSEKEIMLLDLGFRGPCVARIKIDDGEPVERFFKKGDVFRESVKNRALVWVSNAGIVSARVSNKELPLGEEGEPAVWMLTWVRNRDDGQYQLEMVPAY